MSEKSHVGMGYHVCPITGDKHSESVLIDNKLKDSLDKDNFLGLAYGPEAVEKLANGYVGLIEVTNQSDEVGKMSLSEADRTGTYCFVKKGLVKDMFGIEEDKIEDFQFVSSEVIQFLTDLKAKLPNPEQESIGEPEV